MCSINTDKFYLVNLAYLWSFCSLGETIYGVVLLRGAKEIGTIEM